MVLVVKALLAALAMFSAALIADISPLPPAQHSGSDVPAGTRRADRGTAVAMNLPTLLGSWVNPFTPSDGCLIRGCTGSALCPGSQGSCSACSVGCPSTDGKCANTRADTSSGASQLTPAQKEQAEALVETKKKSPRVYPDGSIATEEEKAPFLNWKTFEMEKCGNRCGLPGSEDHPLYLYSIGSEALGLFAFSLVFASLACCFACIRSPSGTDHMSEDTSAAYWCRILGAGTGPCGMCTPCFGVKPDQGWACGCLKLVACSPWCMWGGCLCPGQCNCVQCLCPRAMLVATDEDDGIKFYNGGLTAKGDKAYPYAYAGRSERLGCCGGNFPSVQYGSCGCGEWGCCCDCCCGGCDILNPCCRMNLFDYERSTGRDVGYSVFQGRMMHFLVVCLAVIFVGGFSVGAIGSEGIVNAIITIVPALINAIDSLVGSIMSIVEGLMNQLSILDEITALTTGVPGTQQATTLTALSTAISTAYDLKGGQLCVFSPVISEYKSLLGWAIWAILFGIMVPAAVLSASAWCCTCMCGRMQRIVLVCATILANTVLYCGFLYLIFNPLSLVLTDTCNLFDQIKSEGAMAAFPGQPPSFCGTDGPFGAFVTQSRSSLALGFTAQCDSFRQLCQDVPPMKNISVSSCPHYIDLSEAQCTDHPMNFSAYAADMRQSTTMRDIKWGCINGRSLNQRAIIPDTGVVAALPGSCHYSLVGEAWCDSDDLRLNNGVCSTTPLEPTAVCQRSNPAGNDNLDVGSSSDGFVYECTDSIGPFVSDGDRARAAKTVTETNSIYINTTLTVARSCDASQLTCTSRIVWAPASADTDSDAECATEGAAMSVLRSVQGLGYDATVTGQWSSTGLTWDSAGGVCVKECTSAMILNGECGIGCGRVLNPPVVCSVVDGITLDQCGDSKGVTAAAALSMPFCSSSNAGDCNKVCSMMNMRKFAKGVTLANTMTAMSKDMLDTGYERFGNSDFPDYASSSCSHPDQCVAGEDMKDVVNCGFLKVIATEVYSPLCMSLLPGFASVATAALIFMWFGIGSFFTLIWGYKRWQKQWLELSSKAMKDTLAEYGHTIAEEVEQMKQMGCFGECTRSLTKVSSLRLEAGAWLVTGDGELVAVQDSQCDPQSGQNLVIKQDAESAIAMQAVQSHHEATSAKDEQEVTLNFGDVISPKPKSATVTYA